MRTVVVGAAVTVALAIAVALLLVGVATPAGAQLLGSLGNAARAVGSTLGAHMPSLRRLAGQPWVAIGTGGLASLGTFVLVPGSRTGRAFALTLLAGAVVAGLVYMGGTS